MKFDTFLIPKSNIITIFAYQRKQKEYQKVMAKEQYRPNKAGIIYFDTQNNPKLGAKLTKGGTATLFLEYYRGAVEVVSSTGKVYQKADRERVSYKGRYIYYPAKTPEQKAHNDNTIRAFRALMIEEANKIVTAEDGVKVVAKKAKVDFLQYYQAYIDSYTKKDKRNVELSLSRFKDFLHDTPRYSQYAKGISPQQLNPDMIRAFAEYVSSRSKTAEGSSSIFKRFRKVVRYALNHDIFTKDPCINEEGRAITIKTDRDYLRKDVLSPEEVQTLAKCHYTFESDDIRRAFLLSCFTGMAFVDVKALEWGQIDLKNNLLTYARAKTGAGVNIPITSTILSLLGDVEAQHRGSDKVFNLKTYESCNKALHRWVEKAGIGGVQRDDEGNPLLDDAGQPVYWGKHISWHCARHTFGTILTAQGANPFVTQNLMGHSSISMTQKYVRAVDDAKKKAIETLPEIEL